MRSGAPLTQLIEFSYGFPDGDIEWELLNGRGQTVTAGQLTPEANSASAVITVSGDLNTVEPGVMSSPRELRWAYTVSGMVQAGRCRYRLEVFLPLGLSEEGVRRKLGVEAHELSDDRIDLVGAYGRFRETVGSDELEFVETSGGYAEIITCDAIEALAGLTLLPSLQVSLAQKESSGTNQYQRAAINWDAIRAQLEQYVADGYRIVNPGAGVAGDFGPLLITVIRSDPVTGATS
jgi:hypothetical protein